MKQPHTDSSVFTCRLPSLVKPFDSVCSIGVCEDIGYQTLICFPRRPLFFNNPFQLVIHINSSGLVVLSFTGVQSYNALLSVNLIPG